MPLNVVVVGAGIGGLCAAVALRRGGHRVTIMEKSKFKTEIGAAVALAPNGWVVLKSLGTSLENLRPTIKESWEIVDGRTLKWLNGIDMKDSMERYGSHHMAIHRVDLHKELLRLVTDGSGPGAQPRLGITISTANSGSGELFLENGERINTDLIVGADGVHSTVREAVLGSRIPKPSTTPLSAFRSLIPTAKLEERIKTNEYLRELVRNKGKGSSLYTDEAAEQERHLVWYTCREGEVQNIVGIHPTRDDSRTGLDPKQALLAEFDGFADGLVELLKLAENVACWPLYEYLPFPRWSSGNAVLIGDAAHPMLPFSGQAANQALEDAGALGALLKDVHSIDLMHERLHLFENVRRGRVNAIQIVSSVRAGLEWKVQDKLREYAPAEKQITTFEERSSHAYGYNVLKDCQDQLHLA